MCDEEGKCSFPKMLELYLICSQTFVNQVNVTITFERASAKLSNKLEFKPFRCKSKGGTMKKVGQMIKREIKLFPLKATQ